MQALIRRNMFKFKTEIQATENNIFMVRKNIYWDLFFKELKNIFHAFYTR